MLKHLLAILLLFPLLAFAKDFSVVVYNKDDVGAKTSYSVATVSALYSSNVAIPGVQGGENLSTIWNVLEGNDASINLSVLDNNNNTIANVTFVAAGVSDPILTRTVAIENLYPDDYIVTADPPPHPGLTDTQNLRIYIERKNQSPDDQLIG